ncbi:hypothetical protein RA19_21610 [Leisingera sp. ANG-M1]|uniref:hypothetical protein n=1 Tax=Leisingera sp. ANG-M1 TaxID=1577895 RepID=UPI00057CE166|nr:hypothetical protein [Leisingera sp. ANG-M1]KIC08033.1 hypothetical protein RA19_21610 [Leisingera sp. ANG-M1]
MADAPEITRASDAEGFLPGPLGLRLDEEFLPLTALNAKPEVLDSLLPFGRMHQDGATFLLRLWPGTIWSSGPLSAGSYRAADIGHGLTRFRLRGVEALHFLDHYTCATLFAPHIRQARCIRTRLGGHDATLWWHNTRDVHAVVYRSAAQSFADHLRALALRHDPADPSTYPRPVNPGAPDRRG